VIGVLRWRPEARVRSPRVRWGIAWLQLLQFAASGLSEPVPRSCKRYAVREDLSGGSPPTSACAVVQAPIVSHAARSVNTARLQRTDLLVCRDLPPKCPGSGGGNELEVAQAAVVFGVVSNQWRGQHQSAGGDPRIRLPSSGAFSWRSRFEPGPTWNIADCPNSRLRNLRDTPPASPICVVPNSRPKHLDAIPPPS